MNGELITAIHAVVYLTHAGDWRTSEEIANNVCTNPVCVRRVMTKLVKAGLAKRRMGKDRGGYLCTGDPDLRELADALGATLVTPRWQSGSPDKACLIASGMADYIGNLCAQLDAACKEYLENIRVSDVEAALLRREDTRLQ